MSMAWVAGIIIWLIGIAGWLLIAFADGMSDAPSQDAMSPWPWLIFCLVFGAIVIATHYIHGIRW